MASDRQQDSSIHILTSEYAPLESFIGPFGDRKIELDLGCGKGSFAAALAQKYPDRLILAADVMLGRLRKVAGRKQRLGLENLVPLRVEARHLVACLLPDSSLERLHVLCPDPWPKNRHAGHRLLCSDFFAQLHRVLVPNGVFHFSTDDDVYFESVLRVAATSGLFVRDDSGIADMCGVQTEFEKLWGRLGKSVRHIAFMRQTV